MANVTSYLGSVRSWHETHCQPIVDALYANDEARARVALTACREELQADSALTPDQRRSLDYVLLDYELAVALAFTPATEVGPEFARLHAAIAALPPAGNESDVVQATLLVDQIGAGTRRGFVQATEAEVDALVARIPERHLTPNVWYYIVAWAFHNHNLKYLELALERQTLETTGFLDDYYWMRTNLMYRLVDGKATRLDIDRTLRGYSHPLHVDDFRNLLLPRCNALGLMDDELHLLLLARETELAALQGTKPPVKPKAPTR